MDKSADKKPEMTPEAKRNLVGFFDLLLKIDQRVNPQNYENNRNSNSSNQS